MIAENIKRLTDKGEPVDNAVHSDALSRIQEVPDSLDDKRAAYADEQYKKLQREKDQYISLDEYCAKRGIE